MLCNEHTTMENVSVEVAYKYREATVMVDYTQNNAATGTCVHLSRWMMFKNLTPNMIKAVDITCRGDHWRLAVIQGSRNYFTLFNNMSA